MHMPGQKQTPLPVSAAGGSDPGTCGGGERMTRFGYILKVNLIEFADGLDVDVEKKRGTKNKITHLINGVPVERVS